MELEKLQFIGKRTTKNRNFPQQIKSTFVIVAITILIENANAQKNATIERTICTNAITKDSLMLQTKF